MTLTSNDGSILKLLSISLGKIVAEDCFHNEAEWYIDNQRAWVCSRHIWMLSFPKEKHAIVTRINLNFILLSLVPQQILGMQTNRVGRSSSPTLSDKWLSMQNKIKQSLSLPNDQKQFTFPQHGCCHMSRFSVPIIQ